MVGIVYVGSLFALLLQSFYSRDDYSGLIVHEFTPRPMHSCLDEVQRFRLFCARWTLAASSRSPRRHRLPRRLLRGTLRAGLGQGVCSSAVMMPLWSSYLVKV